MKRKHLGKIMQYTLLCLVCIVLGLICIMPAHRAMAALTITSSVIDDWTAVAAQATDESTAITLSSNYATSVHIQAFLDSTTAHEGTTFSIQVSGLSSGDEDWSILTEFSALAGTANSEAILDNPLPVASTTIVVADTGGEYETEPMGKWIAIEDGALLINSELVWLTGFSADANITILDGTTNEHVQNTMLYDIAMSRTIVIPFGAGARARVICNNGKDMDGTASSLNWKVGKTVTTALN